jgi:Asp-tRNA(Asn)/Glu-tRNA(Gln) amidotransferase A subunit family amidase
MQLKAPHLGEEALFLAAHAVQSVTDWHEEAPKL